MIFFSAASLTTIRNTTPRMDCLFFFFFLQWLPFGGFTTVRPLSKVSMYLSPVLVISCVKYHQFFNCSRATQLLERLNEQTTTLTW